jgi:hypothetical protein
MATSVLATRARLGNPASKWPARLSQQGAPVMGDNQCSPQKFVQLVGYRDPKAKLELKVRPQPDLMKR